MWGTLDEVVAKLAPGEQGADRTVLAAASGGIRYVYLRREDELAQAVSWLRAEQTGTWWAGDPGGDAGEPRYDRDGITALLTHLGLDPGAARPVVARHRRQADDLNAAWAARYRAARRRGPAGRPEPGC